GNSIPRAKTAANNRMPERFKSTPRLTEFVGKEMNTVNLMYYGSNRCSIGFDSYFREKSSQAKRRGLPSAQAEGIRAFPAKTKPGGSGFDHAPSTANRNDVHL